jgi:hypothetical protein
MPAATFRDDPFGDDRARHFPARPGLASIGQPLAASGTSPLI